jgi:glucose/arabinose dehydrogenase
MRKERGGGFKKQVLARIPAAGNHNGGVIHFGPDGRLWSVTGDAGNKANAQAFNNLAGKLNRMTPKGGTPGDNPLMPNSARTQIWSFGHRNSFGFTFDPQTGEPWQTENGPNCNDEINHPAGGQNRAWGPSESCPNTNQDGPLPRVGPEWNFSSVIAPTGAAFCQGCELGGSVEGKLLFGAFNDDRIRSATLNAGRDDITAVNNLYLHSRFILAVERRASGSVWFSDDRGIYRLDP